MTLRHSHLSAALIAATALLLAGCSIEGAPTTTSTPTETPSPTPSEPVITIDAPESGATVATPVEASGTANTFEAALTVDIVDDEGDTLCIRHIMATFGTGTPGTWETTLGLVPPAADTSVVLRAYEMSAEDGSIVNLVERPIMLSSEHPPIIIESPGCGATTAPGSTLTVSGLAMVFEAALVVELRDASGTAVVTQSAMAASGIEESPWSTELTIPADLTPGFYELVAYNQSAQDGSNENEFPVQIRVE